MNNDEALRLAARQLEDDLFALAIDLDAEWVPCEDSISMDRGRNNALLRYRLVHGGEWIDVDLTMTITAHS